MRRYFELKPEYGLNENLASIQFVLDTPVRWHIDDQYTEDLHDYIHALAAIRVLIRRHAAWSADQNRQFPGGLAALAAHPQNTDLLASGGPMTIPARGHASGSPPVERENRQAAPVS